jgi:hypothetical protein
MSKISIEELKQIVLTEAKKITTDEILSHENAADVTAQEDAWAGGKNIHNDVDWLKSLDIKEDARPVGTDEIIMMIREEVANLAGKGKAVPYGSGWEQMKVDADKKKLVGHSCANHVSLKTLKEQKLLGLSARTHQIGKAVWHSLNENGVVNFYDVQFDDKLVKNVPAERLNVITLNEHRHGMRAEKKTNKKKR